MQLTDRDLELIPTLREPAPAGAGFGINRYLYEIYERDPTLVRRFPDLDHDGAAFVEWLYAYGQEQLSIIDELMPPAPAEFRHFDPRTPVVGKALPPNVGVNVMSFLQAELGTGEAGRQLVAALDERRIPVLPLESSIRPNCRHGHPFTTVPPEGVIFPITITCANPDWMGAWAYDLGERFFLDRYSIGYWWWEVDGPTPFNWRRSFRLVDEVWTASEHIANALRPALDVPVHRMRFPVSVPSPPPLGRAELGLPDGYLFLTMFDYASTMRRKNPLAVVDAFRRSFAAGEGATLVVKCINQGLDPDGHRQLTELAASHPDICIIDRYVSPDAKNALVSACDCYVSLHRAEGFGLPLAEAMYFGKPTIATAYSGNLEFQNEDNSYLVGFELAPIGGGGRQYPINGAWAEPDAEQAAERMRTVFDDQAASRAVGERAARDIRRMHSLEAAAMSMEARLERIARDLGLDALEHDGAQSAPWTAALRNRNGPSAADATASISPARELIARGPVPPPKSELGALGPPTRRLLFRALRPFSVHQRQVDEQLVTELETLNQMSARELELRRLELRRLELRIASGRAAELLQARRPALPLEPFESPTPAPRSAADPEAIRRARERIAEVPFWWHSIEVVPGVTTPGFKTPIQHARELGMLRFPEMHGKTVLDIGGWDGFYALEAEARGARRVAALDHYVWSIDQHRLADWKREHPGAAGPAVIEDTDIWRPEELPGKAGFDIARELRGSGVGEIVGDFMTIPLDDVEVWDITLFLGVLYHLKNPLGGLRRLAAMTGEMAVIETHAVTVGGQTEARLWSFYPRDELGGDPTNWFVPTAAALEAAVRAAGFSRVELLTEPPPAPDGAVVEYRAGVHAFK